MRRFACAILLATAVTFHTADRASAQVYVEPFGGVLIVEDDGLDHLGAAIDPSGFLGGTLGYTLRPRWELTGTYGWAPAVRQDDNGVEEDIFFHVYYAAINHVHMLSGPWSLVASLGAGMMTIQDDTDVDDSSDPMIAFGGGLRYRANERFAVQGMVRDHVQFCKGIEEGDEPTLSICPDDDSPRHHVEVSGGVLVQF
jgi:hypothetical protein